MNAVRDGGPPGWALVGELQSAPGLDRLSHCRLASTTFTYIGYRLRKAGRLQHYKLQGILRAWDVYCYRTKTDVTCGALLGLYRILASPIPHGVPICYQASLQENISMYDDRPIEEKLSPHHMPEYVLRLCMESRKEGAAVCGYTYVNGHFQLWTDTLFAEKYYTATEANARFTQFAVLPCYLYGCLFHPRDRPCFYELLVEYLLTKGDERRRLAMVAEVLRNDGTSEACLVQARHTVMNDGQYLAFAMSFLPLANASASSYTVHHLRKCSAWHAERLDLPDLENEGEKRPKGQLREAVSHM
ncbi:hypothetical protein NGA_0534002 [Nannochloropsis gaditana CCMP526]|uniref:uncharacterized protein n=1 Tax=Nannochloropsis gaditana (strain CCMP526) TaxID=1093141 RepID=UPI00029F6E64|nr:hypothetical protein NGA_0534002 [Nannochloropsis gaditana CCMP526]EKU23311.1 hypothetical protein NGA_0534002 [Nannochloropsis gaditana CCMP526]|eukprot:XP_005852521.1 hypothetical protein NGA_0534002 [Nannochloropsis gaditana CCMP526]